MGRVLEVEGLRKYFYQGSGRKRTVVHAVQDVSFCLNRGGALALVGESGSGKTTLARCLVKLYEPDRGSIRWDGVDVVPMGQKDFRPFRKRIQYVFQDPYSSLDPRMRVCSILEEPLVLHSTCSREERLELVERSLTAVGMDPTALGSFPGGFSGGQRQRISLARALVQEPECLILDEPVSALDVSIQAQFLNLLMQLREQKGYTCIFISHDLAVVKRVCEQVLVFYLGRIVEKGPVDRVFKDPRHPYTGLLLDSIPGSGRESREDSGQIPSNIEPPPGCSFHPRCPLDKVDRCFTDFPPFSQRDGHFWACYLSK